MDAERFLSFVVKWQALFQEYPLSVEEPHTLDEVTDHCEEKLDNEYEVDHVHAVRMEEDELQFRVMTAVLSLFRSVDQQLLTGRVV